MKRAALIASLALLAIGSSGSGSVAARETTNGTLADGTPYRIDMPDQWNGSLLVGLDYAGRDPMAEGETNLASRALLDRGYAMAGTTRTVSGWAIHLSAANAVRTLELFTEKYGKPKYAIEYGSSQGGHTAAIAIQAYPTRWQGAVIQCGGLSGTVGQWQGKLDALFAAKALLAPESNLPVLGIPADFRTSALPQWRAVLEAAQRTPQGQARIALAATLGQLPDWPEGAQAQPRVDDAAARQAGLYHSLANVLLNQAMSSRSQIEALSGGNISGNAGVDYAQAFAGLDGDGLVAGLYKQAGLDLQADLGALARAPRKAADPAAIAYVASGIFDGNLAMPVLTLNGLGDAISVPASQQAYEASVVAAGKGALLRQTYTASPGHCGFTAAESVAAVDTLVRRLDRGSWDDTRAAAMNEVAAKSGIGRSRFVDVVPARFARPFGVCDLQGTLQAAGIAPLAVAGQVLPACRTRP